MYTQMVLLPRKYIFLILIILFSQRVLSQSYFANGNARSLGGECYQLTQASNWQLGSVWYADPIDLSKDFDLEFYLNFGTNDGNGADGIVFVLQDVGNRAIGNAGGGLGFEGFSPSFGIEFDDFENTSMGDIASDHIAILKNGSVNHNSQNSISSPVQALVNGGNIEDGVDHLVRIVWKVNTHELEVWFDCSLRHKISYDIQKDIFSGNGTVYWGFTSSTGGLNNRQVACLRDDILVKDTFDLCKGESILLNARESKNNKYSWFPNLYLDDTSKQKPTCNTTVPMTYYVQYSDLCDNVFVDTVFVDIDIPFVMDEGQDTLLCDGMGYQFDLIGSYDSIRWNTGSKNRKITWFTQGEYSLRGWRGVCYDDDTFTIQTNITPVIQIKGDSTFCEGDSTLVSLDVKPADAIYAWQDGSTNFSKYHSSSGMVKAIASNVCGSSYDSLEINEIIIGNLDLGKDTFLCIGDTLDVNPKLSDTLDYLWSTGDNEPSIKTNVGGEFTLRISLENECFDYDTIQISEINPPSLDFLDDILLCRNEEITLNIDNKLGEITWNNAFVGNSYTLKNLAGDIDIKLVNKCGVDSITLSVDLIDCRCKMVYPSGFSPNGDNLNDVFRPIPDCPKLSKFSLQVYNRWGEQIFETNDIGKYWDGSFEGKACQEGVYFWISHWIGIEHGVIQSNSASGTIQLLK